MKAREPANILIYYLSFVAGISLKKTYQTFANCLISSSSVLEQIQMLTTVCTYKVCFLFPLVKPYFHH